MSEVSSQHSHHGHSSRACPQEVLGEGQANPSSPSNVSQGSLSDENVILDQDLSEDEGLEPDQPSFIGLFRPHMFRSLLFKAQTTTRLGTAPSSSGVPSSSRDPASSLFEEPSVQSEVVPAPKLFSDVLRRQWLPGYRSLS